MLKKTGTTPPSKAAFIRSQPATMSAKEVVAKASEAKMKLSEAHVHVVRSKAKADAKKSTPSSNGSARSARKRRGPKANKRQLVLRLATDNPTWTAEQIAKEAKCSPNYVYKVRRPNKPALVALSTRFVFADAASTTEFYRVLKRIGIAEAKRLIANVEAYENA